MAWLLLFSPTSGPCNVPSARALVETPVAQNAAAYLHGGLEIPCQGLLDLQIVFGHLVVGGT